MKQQNEISLLDVCWTRLLILTLPFSNTVRCCAVLSHLTVQQHRCGAVTPYLTVQQHWCCHTLPYLTVQQHQHGEDRLALVIVIMAVPDSMESPNDSYPSYRSFDCLVQSRHS